MIWAAADATWSSARVGDGLGLGWGGGGVGVWRLWLRRSSSHATRGGEGEGTKLSRLRESMKVGPSLHRAHVEVSLFSFPLF
jgi:hypothetical protein